MTKEQKRRYIKHYISLKGLEIFRRAGMSSPNFYSGAPVREEKLDLAVDIIKQHIKELEEIENEVVSEEKEG